MKIVVLSYAPVEPFYEATLIERGHTTGTFSGAVHGPLMKHFAGYDGCLLLGNEPELIEFADIFAAMGKPVWRQLTDIPKSERN
jgi:hypothetical protein